MVWGGPAVQERAPVDQHLAGIASSAPLGRSLWCTGSQTLSVKGCVGLVSTPLGREQQPQLGAVIYFSSPPLCCSDATGGSSASATIPGRDISPHY